MIAFLKGVFSDNGQPSSGRVMMLLHFLLGGSWGTHVVVHNHSMLDPVSLAALTGFITAPYALTAAKATAMSIFGKTPAPQP